MQEFDWLDQPSPSEKFDELPLATLNIAAELEWFFDDHKRPAKKSVVARRADDPRFATLAQDLHILGEEKKVFLKYLVQHKMVVAKALRAMNADGFVAPERHTAYGWQRDPSFKSAVDILEQITLDGSRAASPAAILLRAEDIIEDALTPVPVYHQGNAIINPNTGEFQEEVDRGSALKGLELLARAQGLLKPDEENRGRVTVVLDFSGEVKQGDQASEIVEEAIDGEFKEVKP